ncbi:MAG: insulinase family protein [Candidatus Dependentiae bacterium]|nr:insulinase family protein [Candidatus Dependentiae bacterium]
MKKFLTSGLLLNSIFLFADSRELENQNLMKYQKDCVVQSTLNNGLTLLVRPMKDATTVSIQLWYNVGSKHEKDGERGIAHFIEHMIFKGTETLSESDIDLVIRKISGNCNAFTWYDYTGYLFNVPVANWDKTLPIMADCMQNCTFKQEHLNSEMKAVIQELKMIKDQFARNLREIMITNIFESHPYHYSTIGFKQDLWSVSRETMLAFYKKYYTPDNAVMVIVGDVDPKEVHAKIEKEFGQIPSGNGWNKQSFYINEDIKSKTIRLYRDVKQSICNIAYVVPGVTEKKEFELETFAHLLGNGRGSRLYKLLVNDLQLVVDVKSFVYDMFDKGIFFVEFSPKNEKDIEIIVQHIQKEINEIAQHGPTVKEVERARRFVQVESQQMLENTQQQAYAIGKSFVATKDPLYPFNYGTVSTPDLVDSIKNIAANYCTLVVRHQGEVLAIPQDQIHALTKLQKESDAEDTLFLGAKPREAVIEGGSYVHTVTLNEKQASIFSKPGTVTLHNGLELIWLHTDSVDTVECQLMLKANHFYDEENLQGIGSIVSKLLLEGTKNYPGQSFAEEVESYGISFFVAPGSMSATFLKQDVEKGLSLLTEMLTNAEFTSEALYKIKEQVSIELKKFWDTPTAFNMQLAKDLVYKNHPFKKISLGTQETIAAISLEDCIDYYKTMITPQGARLAIVGNLANIDVQALIEKTIGQWQGSSINDLVFPSLSDIEKQEITSYINRDQIVLVFTGLSVNRFHKDYDKILLFDQIFAGSVMSSMSTRLFRLRQQSGLFYTIGGSLLYGASEEPGMIFIRTIVSQDRAAEAERAILQVIDEAINDLSEDELQQAKQVLINSFDALYDANGKKASTFLFLKKYDLPFDYFEKRAESLQKITVEEIQQAVRSILSTDKIAVIRIGRIEA